MGGCGDGWSQTHQRRCGRDNLHRRQPDYGVQSRPHAEVAVSQSLPRQQPRGGTQCRIGRQNVHAVQDTFHGASLGQVNLAREGGIEQYVCSQQPAFAPAVGAARAGDNDLSQVHPQQYTQQLEHDQVRDNTRRATNRSICQGYLVSLNLPELRDFATLCDPVLQCATTLRA